MAELVLTLGVPHTPLLWRLLQPPVPDDLTPVLRRFQDGATMLEEAGVDVIVFVASDHFRQLMSTNMPAFMIGRAPHMRGTHPNEERSFGLPVVEIRGEVELANSILGVSELPDSFDFSFSDELWLDHSFVIPLLYLTPRLDVPVVPVYTNTNVDPIPTPGRFAELGRYLRRSIAAWPSDRRVAVVGTGHLAYELGGPRQFTGSSSDPEFDAMAIRWFRDGDVAAAVHHSTPKRLKAAGNLTSQFLNFITCLTVADGNRADLAEGIPCRFGHEPFLSWLGT